MPDNPTRDLVCFVCNVQLLDLDLDGLKQTVRGFRTASTSRLSGFYLFPWPNFCMYCMFGVTTSNVATGRQVVKTRRGFFSYVKPILSDLRHWLENSLRVLSMKPCAVHSMPCKMGAHRRASMLRCLPTAQCCMHIHSMQDFLRLKTPFCR